MITTTEIWGHGTKYVIPKKVKTVTSSKQTNISCKNRQYSQNFSKAFIYFSFQNKILRRMDDIKFDPFSQELKLTFAKEISEINNQIHLTSVVRFERIASAGHSARTNQYKVDYILENHY